MSPSGRRRIVPWATLALLVASCSPSTPDASRTAPPDPRLKGSVLGLDRAGILTVHELPSRSTRRVDLPPSAGSFTEAFWGDDGETLYGMALERAGGYQLYRLAETGTAEPVGPPLDAFRYSSPASGTLLVSRCDREGIDGLDVLDLAEPREWRRVADGCIGALSPDEQTVAFSPDAVSVWEASVSGGGQPAELLRLTELEGIPASDGPPRIISEMVWSEGGLAFAVEAGVQTAVVVVRPPGEAAVTVLPDVGTVFGTQVAWQPGGGLLAIANRNTRGAVLRVLERSGDLRVVGLNPDFDTVPIWSPTGDVLLAGSRASWLFIDPDGEWLGGLSGGRSFPKDWGG